MDAENRSFLALTPAFLLKNKGLMILTHLRRDSKKMQEETHHSARLC
jgi:hypothetical protein